MLLQRKRSVLLGNNFFIFTKECSQPFFFIMWETHQSTLCWRLAWLQCSFFQNYGKFVRYWLLPDEVFVEFQNHTFYRRNNATVSLASEKQYIAVQFLTFLLFIYLFILFFCCWCRSTGKRAIFYVTAKEEVCSFREQFLYLHKGMYSTIFLYYVKNPPVDTVLATCSVTV
jgi:hypothetical protein